MNRGNDLLRLIRRGVRHPDKVPQYLIGRLFPGSKWGPNWRREDGFITFELGGFAGGSPTRPELCARLYYEATQIDRLLGDRTYDRSLEIGCGYGRLSGWISAHADASAAIEPNGAALGEARELYPDVDFREALADDLPFPPDHFDLVVSWCVLGHVPPKPMKRAAEEIRRVLRDDGTLLLCEATSGESTSAHWVRSKAAYESLLAPYCVVESERRDAEPPFDYAERMEAMRLEAR